MIRVSPRHRLTPGATPLCQCRAVIGNHREFHVMVNKPLNPGLPVFVARSGGEIDA